jgi:succinate--hydroxymethylglutarate CoA-transferase
MLLNIKTLALYASVSYSCRGPPFASPKNPQHQRESAYFLAVNRNKKSVAVDLKSAEGVDIVQRLATHCDVLIENFLPGKLDALGLSYETLSRLHPGLIYASISGYGTTGPYAQKPGYDVIVEAEAGLMHITGESDGPPVKGM